MPNDLGFSGLLPYRSYPVNCCLHLSWCTVASKVQYLLEKVYLPQIYQLWYLVACFSLCFALSLKSSQFLALSMFDNFALYQFSSLCISQDLSQIWVTVLVYICEFFHTQYPPLFKEGSIFLFVLEGSQNREFLIEKGISPRKGDYPQCWYLYLLSGFSKK